MRALLAVVAATGGESWTSALDDRAAIAALPKDQRFVRPPFAPDWDAIG